MTASFWSGRPDEPQPYVSRIEVRAFDTEDVDLGAIALTGHARVNFDIEQDYDPPLTLKPRPFPRRRLCVEINVTGETLTVDVPIDAEGRTRVARATATVEESMRRHGTYRANMAEAVVADLVKAGVL